MAKPAARSIRGIIAACILALVALPAQSLEQRISEWLWAEGDEAAWAAPDFDDADWSSTSETPRPSAIGSLYWMRARVELSADAPERLWFLCGTNGPAFEFFVNGVYSGSRGSPLPLKLNNSKPAHFLLPPAADGTYVLALRCAYYGASSPLPEFSIADEAAMSLFAGLRTFLNTGIYAIFAALNLFLGAYFLSKWVFRGRSEKSSALFSFILLFCAAYFYSMSGGDYLINASWFRALTRSSIYVGVSFLPAFMIAFFDLHPKKLLARGSVFLALGLTIAMVAVSADDNLNMLIFTVGLAPLMAVIVYAFVVALRSALKGRSDAWPVTVGIGLGMLLAAHDVYYQFGGRTPFAWIQGIAFFMLTLSVFVALSMRESKLAGELTAYAEESREKNRELAGYLEKIVAAGQAAAAIAEELDQAASAARVAAVTSAGASRAIDERSEGPARDASRTEELVSGFAESAGKVDGSLSTQSSDIERTAAAAIELSAGAESVAGGIEKAAAFTESLAALTERGLDAAGALELAMRKIQESSSGIAQIVDAMDQFAERTNLLAMNAAIEAAHAGQSGRGFGIIANEVKKLAQAQAERAVQIKNEVTGITARVEEGAAESAKARAALGDISGGAVGAAERLAEVRQGTQQQARASAEIRDAMGELASVAASVREESLRQAEMAKRASVAVASVSTGAMGMREASKAIAAEAGSLVNATRRLVDLAARCRQLTASLAGSTRA